MLTWRGGQRLAERARSNLRQSEREFMARLSDHPPARLPGTAAFFTSGTVGIPLPLTHHLRHIDALHQRVFLVTVLTSDQPRLPDAERVEINDLSCGVSRVTLKFGFIESPSVPAAMRIAAEQADLRCDNLQEISYYIGRETIIPSAQIPGMWVWREALFAFMQRNAERSAAYFCIPTAQVVEIGIEIEI
jgi:KUP system potassium uptake protein